MSRWRVKPGDLKEYDAEKDVAAFYTMLFTCTNTETKQPVTVTFGQLRGEPISEVIAALRAVAQVLTDAAHSSANEDAPPKPEKLN